MRSDRSLAAALALLLPSLAACSALAPLTRPEGGGGWSEARRGSELARRADAAEVPWEAAPAAASGAEAGAPAPLEASGELLDLARALYQAHTRRAELQQLMGRPLAELAAAP
jgi:hypothetical protein